MAPKKLTGARRNRDDNEADGYDQRSLRDQDKLIRTNAGAERPFTIARLFKEKINEGLGKLMDPDWTELKHQLCARKPTDKPWFLQVAIEEVGSEPRLGQTVGDVHQVQFVGVAEAESNDTLSPSTFIIREHRANADLEDCQPEKIRAFANHGFEWLEILQDDGATSTNCFLLVTKNECDELLKKEQSFFSFGATAGATTTTNWSSSSNNNQDSSNSSNNNSTATGGFGNAFASFGQSNNNNNNNNAFAGFGSNNNNNNSSGFGNAAPTNNNFFAGFGGASSSSSSSQQPQTDSNNNNNNNNNFGFGFGAVSNSFNTTTTTVASSIPTSTDAAPTSKPASQKLDADASSSSSALPAASSGVPRDAKDVQFQLFSLKSLKDMQTITTAGSKIVLEDVSLSDGTKWKKLKMENDLHDKVAASAQAAIDKQFAKDNEDMQALSDWLEDCPIADPKVTEPLVTVRERALKLYKSENEDEYEALAKHKKDLEEALKVVVEQRKEEIALEQAILNQAQNDLKDHRVLSREKWRVLKFHPKNDVVKFRPHNKFRALGTVDQCLPPAFDAAAARQSNAFFKKD